MQGIATLGENLRPVGAYLASVEIVNIPVEYGT